MPRPDNKNKARNSTNQHACELAALWQMLSAECMLHTSLFSTRFDLGSKVFCHVEPEGWIEGTIVKLNYDGIPYNIELAYNSEVVACPMDRCACS